MSELLENCLHRWSLSDPYLLAETPTSQVYTVWFEDTQVVLKVLKPLGYEEKTGAAALRYFNGSGAVKLLRANEDAYLLEYADGEDLKELVERGEDEQATEIIADVLNKLHSVQQPELPHELFTLNRWFHSLFVKADQDQRDGVHSIYVNAASLAQLLLADPHDVCVLHGDIHHENIRFKDQRGWLAFDPKGLIGERTFDAANTLCNPITMPHLVQNESRLLKNADILAHKLNIDRQRILQFTFAYACLSASWIVEDGDDPDHDMAIAQILIPHIQF